ncbi:MAG: DUF456 domain-containing protein [Gemmatimonadaceae bacterium]|nr:DUF456 domain-containing protein [Gemmatimonadaceae bacterium]
MLSGLLLVAALLVGLALVPLGLPGLWGMLGATLLHWVVVPAGPIGPVTFGVVAALVVVAEVLEFTIAGRYAREHGGSRRASFGAILGGLVGAVLGVPVPVVGSMLGAFAGAFVGALLGELTVAKAQRGEPVRVARGALLGRVAAAAVKTGIGVAIVALVGALLLTGRLTGG